MNVAPHLLTEDRAEYERVLDDALSTAHARPELAGVGTRLTVPQLRAMTLNATALVTSAAASEYDHFVKVREQNRTAAGASVPAPYDLPGPGAGAVAIVTVMVPVLAGAASVIFLLVGAVLHALAPTVAFGATLLTAGLVFGSLAAAGLLCAAAGLLVTALRNSPAEVSTGGPRAAPDDELSRAREAWRLALLERGVLPFLRDALAATGPSDPSDP
ncbi:membrane protein [Streptomyces sp. NRRL F-6491]|nr:membrane protein [Streptomyces sp. NRRL F-6491]KOX52728.1 membrane protein [Streptomyces sp. NRRL F-6492]